MENMKNMKSFKAGYFARQLAVISLIIFSVASCKKDNVTDYKYFVSKEFKISYTSGFITSMVDVAAIAYPEIGGLKQYISTDVDVYRIVYNTSVNNEPIKASGLICVPSAQGEYPVLCFQNGTNTVNANCPSENVTDPSYQMVEAAASLGFIVLMPDYPGFGESSDIPHPYLITEPTVKSITDMLYAVKELGSGGFPGITIKNEYYLLGYSQGGWATLALHKAIEQEYSADFNVKASVCGAGPYDMTLLFNGMVNATTYQMPVYIAYIVNAYSVYNQFTNPVTDIFNEPYASMLNSLFNGNLTSEQINSQLTVDITALFTPEFLSGHDTDPKYSSVREALVTNSVSPWKTEVPLLLVHGGGDTTVDPSSTENIYNGMIQAGTSADLCKKEIIPSLNHGEAKIPAMVKGLFFIIDHR
jgi:pimeloyl-ACP methyl ester carboxylesterase